MTIASEYLADTGETVGAAVQRMYKAGIKIENAAHQIGYGTSSDLRNYLERRKLECPWPRGRGFPHRGRPPIKITEQVLDRYCEMRIAGMKSMDACKRLGQSERSIYCALKRSRPGVKLPTYKG